MKANEVVFSEDVTFRYRSAKSILDYSELENSEIYFCPFNEEDDIFEGTFNMYWQADEILWNNFLAHYLLVMSYYYSRFMLIEENKREVPKKIEWRIDRNKIFFERGIREFLNTKAVKGIKALAMKDNHKVQPYEMKLYLKMINSYAFKVVHSLLNPNYSYTDNSKEIEISDIEFPEDPEKLFSGFDLIFDKVQSEINCNPNKDPLIKWFLVDFPSCYFQILPEMTFPQWYVASFCKNCYDGRNWAQYGDYHKGVCLVFKTHDMTNGRGIKLKLCHEFNSSQGKIYRYHTELLKTVTYKEKNLEFNFFEMLGTMPNIITESWMKDSEGNVSELYKARGTFEQQEWNKKYWTFFEDIITSKNNDWTGLEEERIVLEDNFFERYNNKEDRKIKYDFNDLKGIIFGYCISAENKQKIKNIIKEKCNVFKRKDFEFYYVDKNYKTGKIVILKEMQI